MPIAGRTYVVPVPAVRQALVVVAALDALQAGEEGASRVDDAWLALKRACRAWLPADLLDVYFGEDALPAATAADVRRLLEMGIDLERHARDEAEVKAEARTRTWFAVLADYADALSTAPAEILDTPWPLFVALAAEVFRLQARRQADIVIGRAAAHGSEGLWEEIMRVAGYARPEPVITDLRAQDAEWLARQQEKARLYQTMHTQKGEA